MHALRQRRPGAGLSFLPRRGAARRGARAARAFVAGGGVLLIALGLPGWAGAQAPAAADAASAVAPAAARAAAPAAAPAAPAAPAPAPAPAASAPAAPDASAPDASASAPGAAASAPTAASAPIAAASAPANAAASLGAEPRPASAGEVVPCPPPLDTSLPTRGQDRGLMWRISRGAHVSHLYGTVHVGRPGWQVLGPLISAALRASDTLALEVDPTDPAVIAALEDKTPPPPLPEALRKRLIAATERACVPLLALANLHPVLQATTLTVLDARWLGLDPNHSLELLLVKRAKAQKKRVVSLETPEQQKQLLVPTDPAEAVAVIEQTLDQLDSLVSRRVLERLVRAWELGDLATLERYEDWCECAATDDERAFLRRLNDERNAPLADRIAALHTQGRRVFAAIGALHMTGAAALPRLLADRGFKVERVDLAAPAARR